MEGRSARKQEATPWTSHCARLGRAPAPWRHFELRGNPLVSHARAAKAHKRRTKPSNIRWKSASRPSRSLLPYCHQLPSSSGMRWRSSLETTKLDPIPLGALEPRSSFPATCAVNLGLGVNSKQVSPTAARLWLLFQESGLLAMLRRSATLLVPCAGTGADEIRLCNHLSHNHMWREAQCRRALVDQAGPARNRNAEHHFCDCDTARRQGLRGY